MGYQKRNYFLSISPQGAGNKNRIGEMGLIPISSFHTTVRTVLVYGGSSITPAPAYNNQKRKYNPTVLNGH